MSRADELTRLQFCEDGCNYDQARAIIRELETKLAQRDQRIAALEQASLIDGATLAEQHARIVDLEEDLRSFGIEDP